MAPPVPVRKPPVRTGMPNMQRAHEAAAEACEADADRADRWARRARGGATVAENDRRGRNATGLATMHRQLAKAHKSDPQQSHILPADRVPVAEPTPAARMPLAAVSSVPEFRFPVLGENGAAPISQPRAERPTKRVQLELVSGVVPAATLAAADVLAAPPAWAAEAMVAWVEEQQLGPITGADWIAARELYDAECEAAWADATADLFGA